MPDRFLPLFTLLLAGLAGPAFSQGAAQAVRVEAAVMARTSVQVRNAPASIEVSEQDIRRGFVEASQPVTVAVHSNVPSGVALHFHCAGEVATQAVVEGEGAPLLLAWQRQPRQLQLKIRFLLSPQARAGSYPWPLRVSAAT